MFERLEAQPRTRITYDDSIRAQVGAPNPQPSPDLPPSVARVAVRTRLSAELLAAMLTVDGRTRATLDDMERADALADALLTRRRQRVGRHRALLTQTGHRG